MSKLLKVLLLLILTTNTLFAVSISTNKEDYAKGESIIVEVSDLPKTKNCAQKVDRSKGSKGSYKKNDCSWVGLFYAKDKSDSKHLLKYKYAGTNKAETFTFTGLNHRGDYEARVFFKNDYKKKGETSFSVSEVKEEIQIKTQKEIYKVGENISVTVTGLAGNKNDWIGIFYAFDGNEERHVVRRVDTGGKKEGTFTLKGLSNDHKFEVRAFLNGSFVEEDYYPFEVIEDASPASVRINEVMAAKAHTIIDPDFSKFSDWVELYNSGSKSIDLSGYKLSDKVSEAKWTIPNGTILRARSYMMFWADSKDTSLSEHHTNFKFKDTGEAIALFSPEGQLLDSIKFGQQKTDISYAKNGEAVGFTYPTPMQENWDISTQFVQSEAPEFSEVGGFHNSAVTVALTAQNSDEIYYTVDGSYPTYGSTSYTTPISINKTTVLRAMSVESGKFQSERVTHTYLIDESTTLPVVSITTDEKYLWNPMIGIYTTGINGAPKVCGEGNANYMQEWKRPANIEYFAKDKTLGFSQEVDIEISGTCTRELAQKSLNIKADDIYGKDTISYKLFEEKEEITEFKSFKLRSSGQDWWKTMFRDAMTQQLIKGLDIDYQAYEPSIVFLNGEYWGIHNIREKKNEDYLANNYAGLDPDKVDILYGDQEVKEGKADDYAAMIRYIENNNDLSTEINYAHVAAQIDINNYIDYQITQIYIANFDWPANNIRYWKEQKEGAKWRWMMDDQDAGFNLFDEDPSGNPEDFGLTHDTLAFAVAEDSDNWRNEPWSTFLLRNLLTNDGFKNSFVDRYNALLTSTFQSNNVVTLINQMKAVIEPEMSKHIEKWGDAGPDYDNKTQWNNNVGVMLDFANERPAIAKGHLDAMFP